MDNIFMAVLVFIISFALGLLVVLDGEKGIVKSDCEKYGAYVIGDWRLTCAKETKK